MNNLIDLLIQIEKDETIHSADTLDLNDPLVYTVYTMAQEMLITKDGKCNWENIEQLKVAGYYVFPVERDNFGWVIGGISTNKGVITYG